MCEIVLAFKKSSDDGIAGQLIDFWSQWDIYDGKIVSAGKSGFCHIETVFPNGMSFSSQAFPDCDGKNYGVRWKKITYSNPCQWVFVKWNCEEPIEVLYKRANSLVGLKYAWENLILYEALKIHVPDDKSSMWCSESSANVLRPKECNGEYRVSPNLLANIAIDKRNGTILNSSSFYEYLHLESD